MLSYTGGRGLSFQDTVRDFCGGVDEVCECPEARKGGELCRVVMVRKQRARGWGDGLVMTDKVGREEAVVPDMGWGEGRQQNRTRLAMGPQRVDREQMNSNRGTF